MGVDVKIIVGRKIDIFTSVNGGQCLGRALVAAEKGIVHTHFSGHLNHTSKRELETHVIEARTCFLLFLHVDLFCLSLCVAHTKACR